MRQRLQGRGGGCVNGIDGDGGFECNGGRNKVWEFDLKKSVKTLVHAGDPEPTDITVAKNGKLYWTCTSAGVIVEAARGRGR